MAETESGEENTPNPLLVVQPPQYVEMAYWVVLSTNDGGNPRVLRSEPRTLTASEMALRLVLQVPRRKARKVQTIVVRVAEEDPHVSRIEVLVPESGEAAAK